MSGARGSRGFSLVELLIACALTLVALAITFAMVNPSQSAFAAESERADEQQRLRAAVDSLARELRGAGRAARSGPLSGQAFDFWAPLLPLRLGRRNPDPPGTVCTDVLTIVSVSYGAAETTLAGALAATSGVASLALDPACPPGDRSCGFRAGDDVVVYDGTGASDLFTVLDRQAELLTLQHNSPASGYVYPAGSKIAAVTSRTFFLKEDAPNDLVQLMRYDGGVGQDVPVVDHVVSLRVELRGDPRPPRLTRAETAPAGPWTDYGMPPPPLAAQPAGYPPGENCLFARGAGGVAVSRLLPLAPQADGLAALDVSMLTDGPWCPDALHPNRFDADLLRVRSVVLTLRVEVANAAMRGPAGVLFSRGGTSRSARRFVPDEEVTVVVSPGNLAARR
ncbi:MAG: prepilin-type N-terminal cleavage/methylation domain-containing protein [Acidobacteriaceae bacterium]|jgi:Tfp pilus assembly protein PilW|nr:prepilin-type N-terminal cleavage/methylation domain-containing protein [Acidobacteriaceae bacterium]